MEQGRVKALFAWTEQGRDTAVRIAGLYREAGMEIFLYGLADVENAVRMGEEHEMTHVLFFYDAERLRLASLADEIGGFTAELLVGDLQLPAG